MNSIGHITWVEPERLERSWLPEYFAPRFRQVDEALLSSPDGFGRLGDVVRNVVVPTSPNDLPTWVVRRRGDTMSIERLSRPEEFTERESFWIALPEECVVLDAMVFEDGIAATFWSNKVFGGNAATSRNSFVLVSTGWRDIAWLQEALSEPLVTAQLGRAAIGGVLPRITLAALLEVRIPRLSADEERATSQLVRRSLTKRSEVVRLTAAARNRSAHGRGELAGKVPVLTAATFEQRVEQFERLLLEDQLADYNTGFLVQAAREDRESDLFVIRRIGDIGGGAASKLSLGPDSIRPHEDEEANRTWRRWYWDADSGTDYEVFNAIAGGPHLPTHILARSLADPRYLAPPVPGRITAPAFAEFRAAIEASRDADAELDLSDALMDQEESPRAGSGELGRLWERLNPGVPPTEQVMAWLRSVYRPVLAIRVLREQRVAGAYLLFGTDQLQDPSGALVHLELLGERLVAVLRQPSRIAEEAARSESLRRLSWMMHQLGGPLTRIGNVVEELVEFARTNPEAAAKLLPDDQRAKARAAMTNLPIEEYSLEARLMKLVAAVEEIRRLRYLIRRYRNAQGNLQVAEFDLRVLLEELATNARGQFADLHVRVECDDGLVVEADRGLIRTALAEVVSNACRECRERRVTSPNMTFVATHRDNRARITIEDNGFPTNETLLADVFAEDASTYRAQGKGSGLGLAVVKETFLRHGSRCGLEENRAVDGSRRPGVTFWADLAVSRGTVAAEGSYHV